MSNMIPEAEATPDEAFGLGKVAGYDDAMREVFEAMEKLGHTYRNEPALAVWADGTRMALQERLACAFAVDNLLPSMFQPAPSPADSGESS